MGFLGRGPEIACLTGGPVFESNNTFSIEIVKIGFQERWRLARGFLYFATLRRVFISNRSPVARK
jgi:hypothetical protein